MGRSASFSGSVGAAWPALSNGDTWDSAITNDNVDTTMYASLNSAVDGSGQGYIVYTAGVSPPVVAALATTGLDTTTGAVSYLCPSVNVSPATSANSMVNLLVLTSTHTVSHYHQIDAANSTGSWTTMVYTKVGDYEYNDGTTFTRVSAWTAYGTVATVGRFRFRTRTGGTNPAVPYVQSSTLVGTDTTSTGASYSPLTISGCVLTNNGRDAINYANNGTATGISTSGTVSLPSALSRYSNQMFVAFSYYSNNGTGTSSGTTVTSGNYGTPSFGYNNSIIPLGTTTATRKVFTTTVIPGPIPSSVKWGALALEIQSNGATDTWPGTGVTGTRLAATTSYGSAEVRASNLSTANNGSAMPVIRHCVVTGTRWWISYGQQTVVGKGSNAYYNNLYLMKGDGTTVTLKSASWGTTDNTTAVKHAVRVRNSSGSGLWISAKSWTTTEPAWPLSEGSADTSGTDWRVVNVVDNSNAGSIAIAGAGTGRNGLTGAAQYGSSASTWTSFSDLTWFDGDAALSGAGNLSASASVIQIVTADAAVTGAGQVTASATVIATALADAALTGTGGLSATASLAQTGEALITGQGSLTATADVAVVASASLSGSGTLTASGNVLTVYTISAAITGQGGVTGSASVIALAGASLIGQGLLSASAAIVYDLSATITGTGTLTADGFVVVADPLQVRETFTRKVGTGLANTSGANLSAATTIKIGTGEVSVGALVPAGTTSTKVGSGLTYTIIKEV
ncbi:hypothetical protein UFOVP978_6 [uncultured Caudovirales phage]|uniref:Uncharacterized protein n=1 Tax=uncultured Caudovirales phage TaxID=2100421 RepID=A0A6J5Q3G6_9CAUD|nr:hypothetical protein UFOVP978_6 [uncultured Caudovirales phage]